MAEHDKHLDERLRDVPIPSGLEARATAETMFGDDAIDRLLAAVALPPGLAGRLRTAAETHPEHRRDGRIDLDRIATKVRRDTGPGRRATAVGRWMAALARDGAAVAVALSVAWLVFTAGSEFSRVVDTPSTSAPRAAVSDTVSTARPREHRSTALSPAPAPPADGEDALPPPLEADESLPRVASATTVAEATAPTPAPTAAAGRPLDVRGAAVSGPDSAAIAGLALERPRDSWRLVPRVAGFDLAFEMATGESPFVDPSIAGLASDTPPLAVATDSFDRLLLRRDRRWKGPSHELRMEHVLAAFPAPVAGGAAADGVRLNVFGVRSLRQIGGAPTMLVEIAATADGGRVNRPPLEATLVLDRSVGGEPLAWTWLCHGLAAVGAQMTAEDRLSVVIAGPLPRLAVRGGTGAEIAALAAQLARLPATDVADIDAAIRMAERESTTGRGTLVIGAHEATADRGRDEVRGALRAWHAFLASAAGDDVAGADVPRFVLIEPFAAGGSGSVEPSFGRTCADGVSIRRALVRQVFGDDTLVARRCRITVSFDPRQVAAYRLVGHRQTAMESLASSRPAPLDLHVGETARVVYEVVPRGRPGANAVSAELAWQAAEHEAPRTLRRALADAPSLAAAPLPAPHGCELILAAAVAEALADSAHADPRIAKEAVRLVDRWRQRGDMTAAGERLAELVGRPVVERRPPR